MSAGLRAAFYAVLNPDGASPASGPGREDRARSCHRRQPLRGHLVHDPRPVAANDAAARAYLDPLLRHLHVGISGAAVQRLRPGSHAAAHPLKVTLDYALSPLGLIDGLVVLPQLRAWAWPHRAGGRPAGGRAGRRQDRALRPGADPGHDGDAQRRPLAAGGPHGDAGAARATSSVMYLLEHDAQPQLFSHLRPACGGPSSPSPRSAMAT